MFLATESSEEQNLPSSSLLRGQKSLAAGPLEDPGDCPSQRPFFDILQFPASTFSLHFSIRSFPLLVSCSFVCNRVDSPCTLHSSPELGIDCNNLQRLSRNLDCHSFSYIQSAISTMDAQQFQ